MVHTISLYEVCSKRYLDLEVQPGRLKNEFQAICNLMDRYAYGGSPIFIADRGFSSYNVFTHAIENNVDFLIRAKDLNVQRFLGVETLPDKLDTTIELILTRTQSKKKHKHPEKESQYRYICKNIAFDYLNPADISDEYLLKLRVVRVEVSDGVFENIIWDSFSLCQINHLHCLFICRISKKQDFKIWRLDILIHTTLLQFHITICFQINTDIFHSVTILKSKAARLLLPPHRHFIYLFLLEIVHSLFVLSISMPGKGA